MTDDSTNAQERMASLRHPFENGRGIDFEEMQLSLHHREKQLRQENDSLRKEYEKRERSLLGQLKERDAIFASREEELQRRSAEIERRAANYEVAINELRSRALAERKEFDEKYEATLADLVRERDSYKKEIQVRIEGKSAEYVNDAVEALKTNEKAFYWTSFGWSLAGGLGITLGLASLIFSLYLGMQDLVANKDIGWMLFSFMAVKSVVVISVVFALAKYSMMFSKSYMHESLRNIERQHAINFGKFYLGTYGAGASWESVKAVFEHWNISRDSAFLTADKDKDGIGTAVANPTEIVTQLSKACESLVEIGKKISVKGD